MNIVDQVYMVLIYIWSVINDKAPVMGFFIAVTVASLRLTTERQFKVTEVLLCGVLAAILCTGGELLSSMALVVTGLVIPANVIGGFTAGVVGYAGSKSTMYFLKQRFIKEGKDGTDKG